MSTTPERLAPLADLAIELPSWAFGNSGTRFKVFGQTGVPRDPYEKIEDAAQVNRYTGVAPSVALHIPWDKVDDYGALAAYAAGTRRRARHHQLEPVPGRRLHARQLCHPDAKVRAKAVDHLLECVDVMDATGSRDLKLWLPDGTNYPGQDDIRARQDRLAESLQQIYAAAGRRPADGPRVQVLRAAFYTTDVPDWGTSLAHCIALGPRRQGRRGHRPPRPRHQHRVHRGRAAAGRQARRVRLQLALLRRRRPHGRRRGPVPALPDHARGREGRRSSGRVRRGLHARPVPQHRAQDPRPDPQRAQRPGGDRQGPARGPAALSRPNSGRATCSAPRAILMDAYDTDVAADAGATCARRWAWPATRSRPSRAPATWHGSPPSESEGTQAGWGA